MPIVYQLSHGAYCVRLFSTLETVKNTDIIKSFVNQSISLPAKITSRIWNPLIEIFERMLTMQVEGQNLKSVMLNSIK